VSFAQQALGLSSHYAPATTADTIPGRGNLKELVMKLRSRLAVLLGSALFVGAASAQDVIAVQNNSWAGFYAGGNLGGAWNNTCNSWQLNNVTEAGVVNAFNNRDCPNNGVFVGGLQIGYNFQYQQWVWGFGLDYDFFAKKDRNVSRTVTGPIAPAGTYTFNSRTDPNGFAILGPRVGYAFGDVLPYFRIGGVFTTGTRDVTASYTPAGASAPTASFNGGKNYKANGFGAGVGVEYALIDTWSLRGEYTYVKLGKGKNSDAECQGTPAACAAFTDFELDNIHNSFTANIFRVGINYKF
jgi:outer membrane immunogenic protein